MTERVDLREFIGGFIAESDELVAAANAALLEIEAANATGSSRPRAVHDLYRALHTIKGLAGMIGVEAIVEIAHGLEALVRVAERGSALDANAVDVVLRGVAAIGERVRAVADQRVPAPAPPALLEAIAAAQPRVESRPLPPAAPVEQQWLVTFTPTPAHAARGVTIGSVRTRLAELGEIVKVVPRATPELATSLAFDILIVSTALPAAIAEIAATTTDRVVAIGAPLPAPPPAAELALADPEPEPGPAIGRPLVRVELTRLDELQEQLSHLIVSRFRLEREAAALAAAGVDVRGLREVVELQGRQLRALRRAILRTRMVRVSEVLEPLGLLVRSLARTAQRDVRLELVARDAELDKAVADRLLPALVHLVRNAVDHAIESPEARTAAGKPRTGLVRVTCTEIGGNRLELAVEDDGRGIDRAAVARRANRAIDDDRELLDVLAAPGFSTRHEPSHTSGRGLGMDIVKRIATGELGGELLVASTLGAGTQFTLRVPLTIAVVEVFSFVCGAQTFVVRVSSVEEILELARDQSIAPPADARDPSPIRMIERRGRAISVVSLGTLLAIDSGAGASKAIVTRHAGEPVAFAVDRMLGRHEVVVRPIDDTLVKVRGIAGATDLGDGRPTLMLDLDALRPGHRERRA